MNSQYERILERKYDVEIYNYQKVQGFYKSEFTIYFTDTKGKRKRLLVQVKPFETHNRAIERVKLENQ